MGTAASSSPPPFYIRRAHHAGSWYDDDPSALNQSLQDHLDQVITVDGDKKEQTSNQNDKSNNNERTTTTASLNGSIQHQQHVDDDVDDNDVRGNQKRLKRSSPLRGLIVPHAGYSYSGATAAYSYHALREELMARRLDDDAGNKRPLLRYILVLHPSHHVYLDHCAVSGANELQTPLGSLRVAEDLRQEILQLSSSSSSYPFTVMNQKTDEEEHSGEMQYPYICKILQDVATQQHGINKVPSLKSSSSNHDWNISVLPIMCGALNSTQEEAYGKLLAPIIARRDVLTIVSTDFCHWGQRFRYQPMPSSSSSSSSSHNNKESAMKVFEYIQNMDRQGMDLMELQQPGAFVKYLQQTRNTICGRHAVAVWLHAMAHNREMRRETLVVEFIHYAQSSPATSLQDSSVSYASAVARLDERGNE